MEYRILATNQKLAREILERFGQLRRGKNPEILKNNFTPDEICFLFGVCYFRTDGNFFHNTLDLMNMLCIMDEIMKKYKKKKGGTREIEDYNPPKGSILSRIMNMKRLVGGACGVAYCLTGLYHATQQLDLNVEQVRKSADTVSQLSKYAEREWDLRSAAATRVIADRFWDATEMFPNIRDKVHDGDDDDAAAGDDNRSDQVALPGESFRFDHVALAPVLDPTQINLSYLSASTYSKAVEQVLGAENTLMHFLTMTIAQALGDKLPPGLFPNIQSLLSHTDVLKGELMSAFTNLQAAAETSQPTRLVKKIRDTQARIMTDPSTTVADRIFSGDTSRVENAVEQLTNLYGTVVLEFGEASFQTFSKTLEKTKNKMKNLKHVIKSLITNIQAIYTLFFQLMVSAGTFYSGIKAKMSDARSDDESPDSSPTRGWQTMNPVYVRDQLQLSRGRSKRKKKPVTHKKPKDKKKGKKSKGKRGTTKGKRGTTKGKIRKTRRK